MNADFSPDLTKPELAQPASSKKPGLVPAEGGLPVVMMTTPSRVPHSKSFGSLIRSYGRGKGLSTAAPCINMPGQGPVPVSMHPASIRNYLRSHLGVNRGSFNALVAPDDVVGGDR